MGYSVQERLYSSYTSYQDIFHECLTFVRSEEDIEDEELDGGIKRQWLSQFEFVKLFSTVPEPRFLSWMALWYNLPTMENGERKKERGEREGGGGEGREREREREGQYNLVPFLILYTVVHSVRCGICTRKPIISFR